MGDAKVCDACGELIDTANRGVEITSVRAHGTNDAWGSEGEELDFCNACLSRPMHEVLAEACEGFARLDPTPEPEATEEK
jgi:hypothetical protein